MSSTDVAESLEDVRLMTSTPLARLCSDRLSDRLPAAAAAANYSLDYTC